MATMSEQVARVGSPTRALVAVPATIKATRERRALTATAFADMIGRSPSWVTRAEQGHITVQDDTLTACASALGVTEEFLCGALPQEPVEGVHFRANTVPQWARTKAMRHANWVGWMLNQIHDGTEAEPAYRTTLPDFDLDLLDGGAAEAAQLFRGALRITGPVSNIAAVLEDAGVFVVDMPSDLTKIDAVTVRTPGAVSAVVLLNTERPDGRKRHTLAHELAHLVLDQASSITRSMRQREADADMFAGEFLAPYAEVRTTLRGITPARLADLDALRLEWGVSMSSLIRRAYLANDISETQYRYWFRTLNQRGLLRDERALGFAVNPTGTFDFLRSAREALYSAADLCAMTRADVRELQEAFAEQWPFPALRPNLRAV